ncbi:MAG TPA: prepilin-type N-terminal cleavage/methylation domain-containing protein [Tepidisphaeraceae bacterium]|nr:prepilin-type N-terminal cleavage/methylation domain-containing protein [Tepidisphaeraceae bacterium]
MPRRRAFTLVELLVVIGIIAVLMGVLLPALAGARRSAQSVRCAANLRSLGAAVVLYANENRGAVPTYQTRLPAGVYVPWYDHLAKYVFNYPASGTPPTIANHPDFERSIIVGCPRFPFEKMASTSLGYNTSTGYGMTALPVAPLEPLEPDGLNYYRSPGITAATPNGRYFKLVEFKNPANRALIADANGWGGLSALDPGPTLYTLPPGYNKKGDMDYYRHGRLYDMNRPGANVLFCDGHVETLAPWQAWYSVRDPARRAAGSDKGR